MSDSENNVPRYPLSTVKFLDPDTKLPPGEADLIFLKFGPEELRITNAKEMSTNEAWSCLVNVITTLLSHPLVASAIVANGLDVQVKNSE